MESSPTLLLLCALASLLVLFLLLDSGTYKANCNNGSVLTTLVVFTTCMAFLVFSVVFSVPLPSLLMDLTLWLTQLRSVTYHFTHNHQRISTFTAGLSTNKEDVRLQLFSYQWDLVLHLVWQLDIWWEYCMLSIHLSSSSIISILKVYLSNKKHNKRYNLMIHLIWKYSLQSNQVNKSYQFYL